ncbi:MAG: virulence-associated E family protein, partial [Polyangia bacterium]
MTTPVPMWSRPIVLYKDFLDNQPDAPAFEDEDLVTLLTSFADATCSVSTCAGKNCEIKKSHLSWSPVEYMPDTTRGDANVTAVNYFVADLDHLQPGQIETVRANIAEFEHVLHSTHSHRPGDECYRLIMPLTRAASPAEWLDVHAGVVKALELPVDTACVPTPARLYATPDSRIEVAPFFAHRRGEALDVNEALQVTRGMVAAVAPTPVAEPITYDLSALRATLAQVRRSKASGDEKQKGHAEILGRVLDGQSIAPSGGRDHTFLRACGLLAYWLPAGTPWPVVLELLRPCIFATDVTPEGLDHWIEEVRDMYARQAASRAAADKKTAEDNEKFSSALKSLSGKPLKAAVDLVDGWETLLIEGKGGPKVCEHNVDLILSCDPEVRDTLRWNEVTKSVTLRGGPFAEIPVSSLDGKIAGWLQSEKQLMAGEALVGRSILRVARENAYDPIAEYLGELAWDGKARLDTFLEDYLGVATDTPDKLTYVRAVSRRWMISLVARALRPGCKVDSVLILEGDQGAGKSSVLEALIGSTWFLDTSLQLGDKDTMQAIAGAWLVELGELASLRRAESEKIKQFITSKTDKFRAPYGRTTEESPRRCVFVGTTNPDGSGYFTDVTGNRRYWPVAVGKVDVAGVARDRDQLLAEAVVAFRAGERWHLLDDEVRIAAAEAADRLVESTAEEAI